MDEKKKILQYLEYKDISRNKFYKITGFSEGFLSKGVSIGADKVKTIIKNFPDLSLDWLIMDEGPMIRTSERTSAEPPSDKLMDLVVSQQETIHGLQRTIEKLVDGDRKKDALRGDDAGCADAVGA